jgi:hypothetical protein
MQPSFSATKPTHLENIFFHQWKPCKYAEEKQVLIKRKESNLLVLNVFGFVYI